MNPFPFDKYTIRTGALRLRDLGYLLAASPELEELEEYHTAVFEWDPALPWEADGLDWTAHSCCVVEHPKQQLVAISDDGDYLVYGQGEKLEGQILGRSDDRPVRVFTRVQAVDGHAVAVGMAGRVYRREGKRKWTRIDQGLPDSFDIESIGGFDSDELYSVGWRGEGWWRDGGRWRRLSLKTNVILTGVCCAPDGFAYVCGRNGVVLRGRGDRWQIVGRDETDQDFWDVIWFKGEVYLSTTAFLYKLTKTGLELVQFGDDPPSTCYHLSAADGVMWSIGGTDVMAFDGQDWTRSC